MSVIQVSEPVASGVVSPHIVGVGVVLVVTLAVVLWGRRVRLDAGRRGAFESVLGAAGLGVWIVIAIWYLLPGNLDVTRSLPLHFCDLTGLIAPVAVLHPHRRLRALLFFWAFALCTQALITPTTSASIAQVEFWAFWLLHTQIMALASFDFFVRDYRPKFGDLVFAVGVGAVYTMLMIPLNIFLDANYAYVGSTATSTTTLLTMLGPWPLRIIFVCLLGILAHFVVFGASLALRRRR